MTRSKKDIKQFESDLVAVWGNYRAEPPFIHLTLDLVRTYKELATREEVLKFIADTPDVPGEAVVCLTKDSISFVVDDEGHLLEFA